MRLGRGALLLVLTTGLAGSALAQHHGPTPPPPVPKQPSVPVQQHLQQKQIEEKRPPGGAIAPPPRETETTTRVMPPLWPSNPHERGTAIHALNEMLKLEAGKGNKVDYLSVTATNGSFLVTKKYSDERGNTYEMTYWVAPDTIGLSYPDNANGWSADWDSHGGKNELPYSHADQTAGKTTTTTDTRDYSRRPQDIPPELREQLGLDLPAHDPAAIDHSKGLAMRDEERAAHTRELAHQIANIGLEAGIFVTSTALPVAGAIIGGGRGFANAYLAALEGGASESEALMRGFGAAGVNVAVNLTGGKLADALKSNPLLAQSIGQMTARAKALVALNIDAATNLIGNFAENGLYAMGEIMGGQREDAWRYEYSYPPGEQYNLER